MPLMLTSRSVKGCRLKEDDPCVIRGVQRTGGVSGGYVDPVNVTVSPRRKAKAVGKAPTKARRKVRKYTSTRS